jgi:hypothetical protein
MTVPEFEKLSSIGQAVARIEERLEAHCRQHEREESRSRARAPWVAIAIAAASWVVSLVALFGR